MTKTDATVTGADSTEVIPPEELAQVVEAMASGIGGLATAVCELTKVCEMMAGKVKELQSRMEAIEAKRKTTPKAKK